MSLPISRSWFFRVPRVDIDWVRANVATGAARLVDVREPGEFAQGHIDGAELVPLGTLASAAADWDRAQPIVLICRSGMRSDNAAKQLEKMGFTEVASMSGGMLRW